ncbi:MAG: single-stranded-DNA-specific exonuclease RecJ [Candidatus Fusobacterium pullicola]|uniref:Single-stranded-DNA-specific exonuclease RecJ n=1 Tax=Candidatus Fusobacterium pullicola TaxID=2838601 RepID=A0A9E2KXJ9_9FUSO|nr:single-stranded-DNA-specific exonuclease RecJ [Candidatus Fusobacterium pullicola]
MRNTRWIYRENQISHNIEPNIDRDILNLLYNRNIKDSEEIHNFLNTSLDNIHSPLLLKDVDRAVERVLKAKENGEDIWIYGDYDVDGITSTSLCYLALSELDISPKYYIPLRDEGYGLNKEAMDYIKSQGGKVIITVDCGISAHPEIEYANSLGLDIIVTDHHEINNGNPPAYAVINPKREDNEFPYKYLAGVGTAFMLIYALFDKLGKKEDLYKYLDIVAIGTVADIVPLLEENRIFTKFGMEQLNRSHWLGISMLIRKIFEDYQTRKFSTYDIGFIIAPIFNAAGRLEDAKRAVELFIEKDHRICTEIINELLNNNSERKEIQETILERAIFKIENEKLFENSVLVVAEEGFHHGVIGIVASKILDRYYKPTIIMEIKPEEGIATASCRSIEGFNMIEALNSMKELFVKYGGHAGAAGFSIKIENIDEFSRRINEYAKKNIPESSLIKPVKLDITIPAYKISYDFIDKISLLEPFGFGNPSPLFALNNCEISGLRPIGKEKTHTMFNVKKDNLEIKNCVWFNSDDVFSEVASITHADIAFKLKLETYKDRYQYKMYVEDMQLPSHKENLYERYYSLYNTVFPIETVIYTRKNLENSELKLIYHDYEVDVTLNRNYLTTLDNQTSYLLLELRKNYGYNFKVSIKDIILKDENYNVHIVIDRDYEFVSYSLKQGELFRDIKNFLLGDFNYNSIQKTVLASVFKEKKNTLAIVEKGRGLNTIIQTIGLYYKSMGEKVLLVTDTVPSKRTLSCVDVADEFQEGYSYYIVDKKMDFSPFSDKNSLVFSNENIEIEGFNKIVDNYTLPENIVFVDEELLTKRDLFSNILPISMRKEILASLDKYSVLYCNRDILLYL